MSSSRLPSAHAVRIPDAVQHVGDEQAAEEHHFRDEKEPHPERGGLVLLLQRLELVLERRMMGVRRARESACAANPSGNFDLPLRVLVSILGDDRDARGSCPAAAATVSSTRGRWRARDWRQPARHRRATR